jgi:hypothetical protein
VGVAQGSRVGVPGRVSEIMHHVAQDAFNINLIKIDQNEFRFEAAKKQQNDDFYQRTTPPPVLPDSIFKKQKFQFG